MANMSYCRFENTAGDLQDCWYAVAEAVEEGMTLDQFQKSLGSDYERAAFRRMIQLCEAFSQSVEELVTNMEIPEVDNLD